MKDITCPHCKHEREADVDDYAEDGHSFNDECRECGKRYKVSVSISTSWDSECLPDDHEFVDDIPFDENLYENCTKCDFTRRKLPPHNRTEDY